jgi:hypothetical protein
MKLVHILIAKSVADTVFVGVLAVIFFTLAFPPHFKGWGEATPDTISGGAIHDALPWSRVELQLFIDGKFLMTGVANQSRPDVMAAGWARDEWNGYRFELPPLEIGEHEAHVYAVHASAGGLRRTLQLVGDPIRFSVDQNGRLIDLSNPR